MDAHFLFALRFLVPAGFRAFAALVGAALLRFPEIALAMEVTAEGPNAKSSLCTLRISFAA
jgi:hypothetical protein